MSVPLCLEAVAQQENSIKTHQKFCLELDYFLMKIRTSNNQKHAEDIDFSLFKCATETCRVSWKFGVGTPLVSKERISDCRG